jgi:carnitine O-acetyltransferase
LRTACKRHGQLTKECSQGLGQDRFVFVLPSIVTLLTPRHLYAMHSLIQREISSPTSSPAGPGAKEKPRVPDLFTDPGYNLLGTSVLSTSNCGNPALRLFGFGPVTPEGYGIGKLDDLNDVFQSSELTCVGYIIKEEGISVCMSSKHLQTRRLLSTLQAYLMEVKGMLVHLWREANERDEETFMDHAGVLRNARTGEPVGPEDDETEDETSEFSRRA